MLTFLNLILATAIVWLACKYFDLKKQLNPTEKRFFDLTNSVASIIDRVEGYNKAHSKEVAELAVKIAEKTSMSPEQINSLETAAKLHDIGMLMVTNDLMKSRNKLKKDDQNMMKNHTLLAEHYIKQEVQVTENIPTIIRWHHERWDGFGYPDSLRGKQIPLPARILAIADSVSAMKSQRNYRKKSYKTVQEIITELKKQSGLQFDPELVKIAIPIIESEEQKEE